MIDSGATYTVVPADSLKKLGIKPQGEETFSLVDGRLIKRKVGNALYEYEGVERAAPILFGEKIELQNKLLFLRTSPYKIIIMKKVIIVSFIIGVSIAVATGVLAFSFEDQAEAYLNKVCIKEKVRGVNAVLCYFRERLFSVEDRLTAVENKFGKQVFEIGQVRGAGLDIDAPTTPVKVPGEVTVNCPRACMLWVNYDVDTRNTQIPGNGSWYQHLYHIFIDDIDQAVYNQVSPTVPNAAYPLSINGVFPVSAGQHTVSIYVKVTGGHLQQFTSHLQVLAIEQ